SNWPKYLRQKSGMAPGFSCAVFPARTHTDISAYIQVLPDIASYFYLVNDILSFYKEILAGETMNYVQVRSKTTGKDLKQVFVEMVREVGDLHTGITAALEEQPEALAAWKAFEYGYISWHLSIERYRLSELGFRRPQSSGGVDIS
ncbi:isoprenoid synthase domain-containing protein, partial [Mycena capillaripes]